MRGGGEGGCGLRRQHRQEIDAGVARKRFHHRQSLGHGERIDGTAAKREPLRPRHLRGEGENSCAVLHQDLVRLLCPVPLEHGEFGMVQDAALAVAKRAGELDDAAFAGRQQFFAGEFRRGSQIESRACAGWRHQIGREGMEMGLVPRRRHQRRGLDLDEIPRREKLPQRRSHAHAPEQEGPSAGVQSPEGRRHQGRSFQRGLNHPAAVKITGDLPQDQYGAARHLGTALVARVR